MVSTINKWAVDVLEANMEGYTPEERKTYLNDVLTHGCASGCVSGVIYYNETAKIFRDHFQEILEAIADREEETGENVISGIQKGYHVSTDVLYNYLVWEVVEMVALEMLGNE